MDTLITRLSPLHLTTSHRKTQPWSDNESTISPLGAGRPVETGGESGFV